MDVFEVDQHAIREEIRRRARKEMLRRGTAVNWDPRSGYVWRHFTIAPEAPDGELVVVTQRRAPVRWLDAARQGSPAPAGHPDESKQKEEDEDDAEP